MNVTKTNWLQFFDIHKNTNSSATGYRFWNSCTTCKDLSKNIQKKQKRTECVHLHLCSVSELPSSFSLFVEFKERIRLSKEILDKQNNFAQDKAKLIPAAVQHYRR